MDPSYSSEKKKEKSSKGQQAPKRSKMVKQPSRKMMPKKTSRKISMGKCENSMVQRLRRPITLNDFMPIQFKNQKPITTSCFQIDEDVRDEEITFSDEDLLLGSTPHNRPLFVQGYSREQKINRIQIDDGSAVNLLPLKTMKEIGMPPNELSKSHLMIQGFNLEGQRAIGKVRLQLFIDDMESNPLFHVIDANTTYNMLLGRPWIHQNGVVSSTLH
ncbi:uncharacterized protein LOC110428122 [Herrania umbratica]|uniref:Uncharacterized protein LOC110428122 n=1 Tax=Herrania umbratica TaxID=108875 RepID=A0A6J1BMM2_9ROSI|nr:uncharacterized protein LOC110428122 [Herrania umbratica]